MCKVQGKTAWSLSRHDQTRWHDKAVPQGMYMLEMTELHPSSTHNGNKPCIECKKYWNEKGFDRCIGCLSKMYNQISTEVQK